MSAVVRAILQETRFEHVLHGAVATKTHTFLMSYADGSDIEEVMACMPTAPREWMQAFDEAWAKASEAAMPGFMRARNEVWSGMVLVEPRVAPPTQHVILQEKIRAVEAGQVATRPTTGAEGDEYLAEQMEGLVVSDHDVEKAINDIKVQNISGKRIMALSLALMSGHVHPMGDSAELRFGSDLRLCPLIRQQRKAGVLSLDDLLKAKNKRDLFQHYTRLAKEFNDRKMIQEATLVSQFWAETSAAFEGDDSGLFVYVQEWNRAYGGRGIPKLLDTDLILRNRKFDAGGASSADMKELKDALKAANGKLNASESASAAVMKRLQKLEARSGHTGGGPTGGGGDKVACFICGGPHMARDCPDKDKGGKPGKAKAKAKAEEEDKSD